MICPPCRNSRHDQCMDVQRQKDADAGHIPGMHPNVSMWCYCAHKQPEPVPPESPQPAGD